jgi:hypothetical protein
MTKITKLPSTAIIAIGCGLHRLVLVDPMSQTTVSPDLRRDRLVVARRRRV